jgi:hypothetical protein
MALEDIFSGMNIFGARAPSYMSSLLDPAELDKLKQQSLIQGLLGTAATYLAQPKNQRYGSALPYLGKAFMGGMQQSQGTYDQASKDYMMAQQIKEFKDKEAQKASYKEAAPTFFTKTPAVTQDVTQAGGYAPAQTEVSQDQMMPNYGLVKQPDVTTQQIVTPEQTQFNQNAALQWAIKNQDSPYAQNMLSSLKTIKEIGTQGEGVFGKIDPKDYTQESITKFASTKNYADLIPVAKAENSIFGKVDPKDYTKESLNKFLVTKNYTDLVAVSKPAESKQFTQTNELRTTFQRLPEVQAWNVTQPILLSAREAAKDTSGASDLNLIYALGKALDPNSVVREGELQLAAGTGSLGDKLKGYYKSASTGGKLPPTVKQDLLRQIESRTYSQKKQYDSAKKQYTTIATKYGLDPSELFIEPIVEPIDISQTRQADTVTLSPAGQSIYNKYKLNGIK